MKKIKYLIFIVLSSFLFLSCSNLEEDKIKELPLQETKKVEEVIGEIEIERPETELILLTVNGTEISFKTYYGQVEEFAKALDKIIELEELNQDELKLMSMEILDNLIGFEVAAQEALKKNYAPSEAEINLAVIKLEKQYENPENLYKELEKNKKTEEEFLETIKKDLAIKKWRETEFLKELIVSDEEAEIFYKENPNSFAHDEQVHLKQIFIAVPLASEAAAITKLEQKVKEVETRLAKGDNFESLILEYSNDPQINDNLGDYGWVSKGQNFEELEEALFKLKVGEVSKAVTTAGGIHFLKAVAKRPKGFLSFEESKFHIMDFLRNKKIKAVSLQKMDELRNKAEIVFLDKDLEKSYLEYLEQKSYLEYLEQKNTKINK